ASVLAGGVQVTFGARNLSYEEAAQVQGEWQDGAVVPNSRSTVFLYPQFLTPNPAAIGTSADFRRALLYAIDRQGLAATFQGGLSPVPDGYLSPDIAEYAE